MPRLVPNITICGQLNRDCVIKVQQELQSGSNGGFKCDCYYGCNAIKLESAFSATPIYQNAPFLKKQNRSALNTAMLHVYFQRGYYRAQNKEELIGFTEFLCESQ